MILPGAERRRGNARASESTRIRVLRFKEFSEEYNPCELVCSARSAQKERRGCMLPVQQGDLSLLQHPAAQELLHSKIPARLAYVWTDGTPRVIPIWFHWNGRDIVMATPPKAPKLK